MQIEPERLPTLRSIAENTIYLIKVGSDDWNFETRGWANELEKWMKDTFGAIKLSELNPFELADSPLARINNWKTGNVRFHFVSGEEEDPTRYSLLYPNRRISLVIGLMHCPSVKDITTTFNTFHEDTFKKFPFLDDSAMRCCAFDISDAQQASCKIGDLMVKGLEVFPPSTTHFIEDTQETAIHFHMRFIINTATSKLIKRAEFLLHECDAVADAMRKVLVRRSSSGLISNLPNLPSIPNPLASPAPANIPSVKDAETGRLVAGAPSYPGDATHAFSTSIATQASRKSFKTLQARLQVWSGKHCLLAGSPLDALARLGPAAGACHLAEDNVWEAICQEAIECARSIIVEDEWPVPEDLAQYMNSRNGGNSIYPSSPTSPTSSPGPQQADLLEGAIALLQKSSSNHAVRRLLAETCVRAADNRLRFGDMDKATEALVVARRTHAEQSSLAWYMTVEARLWATHARRRRLVLCVSEAFARFAGQQEYERAYRVLEDDFGSSLPGFVPFSCLRPNSISATDEMMNLNQPYSYAIAQILQSLLRVTVKRLEDRNRFIFYSFQYLGMLRSKPDRTKVDQESILQLVSEMGNISRGDTVITIKTRRPWETTTFPLVLAIVPLDVAPKPKMEITAEDLKTVTTDNNKKGIEKSAFIYSPFRPSKQDNRLDQAKSAFIFSPFKKTAPPEHINGIKETESTEPEEIYWASGENAFASVELANPFSIPVSCSLSVGTSPTAAVQKVVVPGRDRLTVRLGPVEFDDEQEFFDVTMSVLGAKIIMRLPMPTIVYNMPLLVRLDGGKSVSNQGKGRAYVLSTDTSNAQQIAYEIDPGKSIPSPAIGTLRYCNRIDRPRLVRELLPSVPVISGIKIQRSDTMDHLSFGTIASSVIILDVLDESKIGKDIKTFSVGDDDKELSKVTTIGSPRVEIKVAIPNQAIQLEEKSDDLVFGSLLNAVRIELDGHSGYLGRENNKSISVLSTAPPLWLYSTIFELGSNAAKVKVLDFISARARWSIPEEIVGYIAFDIVAFKKCFNKDKFELAGEDIVWSGSPTWACQAKDGNTSRESHFAFLRPNQYILALSATSKLRVRWWVKCVKLTAY